MGGYGAEVAAFREDADGVEAGFEAEFGNGVGVVGVAEVGVCTFGDVACAVVGAGEHPEGAVVVDAGYNRVPGRQGDVGDVEFASAAERA